MLFPTSAFTKLFYFNTVGAWKKRALIKLFGVYLGAYSNHYGMGISPFSSAASEAVLEWCGHRETKFQLGLWRAWSPPSPPPQRVQGRLMVVVQRATLTFWNVWHTVILEEKFCLLSNKNILKRSILQRPSHKNKYFSKMKISTNYSPRLFLKWSWFA